jgi:hypothetical protein
LFFEKGLIYRLKKNCIAFRQKKTLLVTQLQVPKENASKGVNALTIRVPFLASEYVS